MTLPTRPLTSRGPDVSLLGLGCNSLGLVADAEAERLVQGAVDGGVTLFDTANVYAGGRSEESLGRHLPHDRSGLTIVTKLGHPSSVAPGVPPCGPAQVVEAVDGSLRRLRSERLDVVLLHFPDRLTPFVETLSALSGLIAAGKVGHYGVSNFSAAEISELVSAADRVGVPRPVMVQDEYSLLRRAAASTTLPVAAVSGAGFAPFFPLAGGLLGGRYDLDPEAPAPIREQAVRRFRERFLDEATLEKVRALRRVCAEAGVPMTRVALAWLARQPTVSCIIAGASQASQLLSNIGEFSSPLDNGLLELAEKATAED